MQMPHMFVVTVGWTEPTVQMSTDGIAPNIWPWKGHPIEGIRSSEQLWLISQDRIWFWHMLHMILSLVHSIYIHIPQTYRKKKTISCCMFFQAVYPRTEPFFWAMGRPISDLSEGWESEWELGSYEVSSDFGTRKLNIILWMITLIPNQACTREASLLSTLHKKQLRSYWWYWCHSIVMSMFRTSHFQHILHVSSQVLNLGHLMCGYCRSSFKSRPTWSWSQLQFPWSLSWFEHHSLPSKHDPDGDNEILSNNETTTVTSISTCSGAMCSARQNDSPHRCQTNGAMVKKTELFNWWRSFTHVFTFHPHFEIIF